MTLFSLATILAYAMLGKLTLNDLNVYNKVSNQKIRIGIPS